MHNQFPSVEALRSRWLTMKAKQRNGGNILEDERHWWRDCAMHIIHPFQLAGERKALEDLADKARNDLLGAFVPTEHESDFKNTPVGP